VQAVALLNDPQEQVKTIVDSISKTLQQDVCSLYRIDQDAKAQLLASKGLIAEDYVSLPPGKGLVGLVVKSKHSVNLADAAAHPHYYNLQHSNEHTFKSFCGVPLVRSGKVIGVLVVQSKRAVKLNMELEAFLVTLASQLAMIVAGIPSTVLESSAQNRVLSGMVGAPGIAVGRIQLSLGARLAEVPDAKCDDADAEISCLYELLKAVQAEIEVEKQLVGKDIPENVARIFDTYSQLLSDKVLVQRIESEIQAGNWLPGALRVAIQHYTQLFNAMTDPYLRARSEDMENLGDKLLAVWSGQKMEQVELHADQESIILVGTQVSVSDIARVPSKLIGAVVCSEGSSLSHAAVLAHALGIPAVMGVREIKELKSGDRLIVDGYSGQLIVHASEAIINEYLQILGEEQRHRKLLDALRDKEAITKDGVRITLLVNTGLLADITPGLNSGAEGIGLYRTEIPFMIRDCFPAEEEQIEFYSEVLNAYKGKPVYMRTLDIGADKQLPYFPIHDEENPALGWRGIRLTLDVIQLLVTQVRAMIRAAGTDNNLHIILPMVTSLDEILTFNEMLTDVCGQLTDEGHQFIRPAVGIMIEVPAVISQIENFSPLIDFISIGTNDLSQFLLAIDRNNARVANRYDNVHPAVLSEINRIVKAADKCRLPVSICGEMGADPIAAVLLIGMGVRQISMSAAMLPEIKNMIRMLKQSSASSLAERALKMGKAQEIRQAVEKELQSIGFLD
jgi:phosphotransferase system enzyme I (PtsI)/phosphotransferase system enzyme I (PtsP)